MPHFRRPLLLLVILAGVACAPPPTTNDGGEDAGSPDDAGEDSGTPDAGTSDAGTDAGSLVPGTSTRTMAAFPSRPYDVHVPPGYDGVTPLPVILLLHGGGGSKAEAETITCPTGVVTSPQCFSALAMPRGFLVVAPDGTGGPVNPALRTWNSGGGDGGWQCISGYACDRGVDEKAYFSALLADLQTVVSLDAHRVYATGHSNGAGMSERLACEFPQAIKAIASVAGGNQFSTTRPCEGATAVLEIHGTADPCWQYDGGALSCADSNPGAKISVPATIAGWLARNGCSGEDTTTTLPDTADDGTSTLAHRYACPRGKEVLLLEVIDGGHTWPSGHSQSSATGLTSTDFSANTVILDFFQAHP